VLGWVDNAAKTVRGLKIPGLLSFLVFHNFETPVTGFDQIPEDERPPIQVVFQSYHMMIVMWSLMALMTVLACIQYRRKRLSESKWLLRGLVLSVIFPQVANFSGWMTAEVGRQPWLVYGVLRTANGISTNIHKDQVLFSIIMFLVIYTLLFVLFIYLLNHKIQHGPEEDILQIQQDTLYRNPFETKKEV
jgi:cytochrome bd ubiquinol oxidase subunit I